MQNISSEGRRFRRTAALYVGTGPIHVSLYTRVLRLTDWPTNGPWHRPTGVRQTSSRRRKVKMGIVRYDTIDDLH